jgi:Flp pilus assembly protein TadG
MNRTFKRLRAFGSKLRKDVSGNTMIMVAMGMPMLVGGTGLAVDTAQWYLWQRELQYAVDQAAMSGAYSLSKADSPDTGEWDARARAELQNNKDIVDFETDVDVRVVDYADQTDNSVIVDVVAERTLPFTSMLTSRGARIRVSAQASFTEAATYTSCLVATDEDEEGAITIGGSATVQMNCGIAALSDSEEAIQIHGNGGAGGDGEADISVGVVLAAGGIDDWFRENTDDTVLENLSGLTDPFAEIDPPDNPTTRDYRCTTSTTTTTVTRLKGKKLVQETVEVSTTQASLLPGTYREIDTQCDTTLASGIYVIDGGKLKVNAQHDFTGNGVMFVLKNGAYIEINGGANISLTAPTVAQLESAGVFDPRLAGMLVFEDRTSEGSNNNKLNGNAETILNGKIYLSKSHMQINGSARVTSQCLMIVSNTMEITGNAVLGNLCPDNQEITDAVGTQRHRVYLVA